MLDITKLFGNVKLSQIEETILTYLIENIDICINKGIRSIAKDNFTSPSTIIRLAKKLGYSGFVELMYSLKNKLSTETLDTFFDGINDKNIFNTNYDKACEDFIECIKDGNILISGEGFSEIVSKYMYMKLLVLGKKSILSTFIDFDILFDNH
ncbi:MAG: MurR/RpiR family transcriptional regulator, partial [Clostridium sp.]|nr:MurR/RpiR family transcriptional regulator [Clostridium sp.]